MKAEETILKDCWLVEPHVIEDERGFFFESFNSEKFQTATGIEFHTLQLNQSGSSKGVLRGIHFQNSPKAQAKLISCSEGEVLDVAVDLRKNSPTFGQHFSVVLSSENKKQLYIPKGMGHGFLVLSDYARLMYQVDEVYSPEHDTGIRYNDPSLNIDWGMTKEDLLLSEKDINLPFFEESAFNFADQLINQK